MRLEAGQLVSGRYRLIQRVGAGGMAEVWCAEDTMLNRRIALKFLLERFTQDARFVERFRREASAAAGLQHPNVVGVYDRGEHDGVPYIAMEYVEGASLKDLIARGLSIEEAVEIIRQVLAGARFAHSRGIVHRDLKPQNVLIDAEGRARVADFGIARAGASEITQTGSVLGTAQYLSPEQAQGLAVTAASDIYSIGVMLYEALTGQVPFEGDSAVSVALKQVSERPRPPSQLNPAVPPALDAVVLKALAKDPANRYATADEFLAALDEAEANPYAASGTTAAYAAAGAPEPPAALAAAPLPDDLPPPRRRFWTRGRAAALAVLLLLLGAVAAYALTRPDQANVPTVLGRNADLAKAILTRAGFEAAVVTRPNCAPPNTVLEQDPPAGSRADEGSTVTLTVSTGLDVRVPQLAGLPADRAIERLHRKHLRARAVERPSPRRAGTVIGSDPGPGTSVACDSRVTLLVSRGVRLVAMPDTVGEQVDVARAQLEALGLVVETESRNADEPEGQVIAQTPGPGQQVRRGSRVHLVYSTGAGSIVVPDVVGQQQAAAKATLISRGLEVTIVKQATSDGSADGIVLDQSPDPGSRARKGDIVTIVVGRYVKPTTTTTTSSTTTTTAP